MGLVRFVRSLLGFSGQAGFDEEEVTWRLSCMRLRRRMSLLLLSVSFVLLSSGPGWTLLFTLSGPGFA